MRVSVFTGWAALGIALTSATQLRMAGLPLGPGEMLLALWMAFVGFCLLRNVPFGYSAAFRPFLGYWLISAVILAAGSIVAIVLGKQDGRSAGHDTLAFAFIGPLTCLMAIRLGDISNQQYYLRLARATFFTVSAMGLVLLIASQVVTQLGPANLWYGPRFRGWAENPNQLAMFMHPMPFLGWYLVQRMGGTRHMLPYLLATGVCLATGLATDSDGLKVAWVGGAGIVAVWLWGQLLAKGRGSLLNLAIAYLLIPAIIVSFLIVFGSEIVSGFQGIIDQVYAKGDRGHIGMVLALHGLEAISQSPLVGWGPGAYSGMQHAFGGSEAHNTLVDWGTSTGGLGMLLYLALLAWCALRAVRVGSPWLLGALAAVVADSLFGYSMRQPFFWLMLVLVFNLSEQKVSQANSSARRPPEGRMSGSEPPVYAASLQPSRGRSGAQQPVAAAPIGPPVSTFEGAMAGMTSRRRAGEGFRSRRGGR